MEPINNIKKDNICHDCKKEITIEEKEIKNGVMLTYDNSGEMLKVFKCNDCFEKDKSLSNFKECEVYSRVVGYIRPVKQWNEGKKGEYNDRKEYLMPDSPCCD